MRRFFILFAVAVAACFASANTPLEDFSIDPRLSASNHVAYPFPERLAPALTHSPQGYEPFYIDHYGRHGSRWLTNKENYDYPVDMLEKAKRNNVLTSTGEQVLETLTFIRNASKERVGELSDVGAEQHRAIAKRMMENFPEVFRGDAIIDAKSTIIIRCILSMLNETGTFKSMNPQLKITTDASKHDMYYMGWGYGEDTLATAMRTGLKKRFDPTKANIDYQRFIDQLISDRNFVADSIDAPRLMCNIFVLAGNMQSHHVFDNMDLYYLFTNQELFDLWRLYNIYWYVQWANAPINGNRMPFIERALLQHMIADADKAIANNERGADLRFGHETCVLPLACLMEIDDIGYSCADLDSLHLYWQDYNIIAKACNIQMVFYREKGKTAAESDVLVKVLYNEHEAKLPFDSPTAPYYRWNDIKGYYIEKLKTAIDWRPAE
ncbi:MAG: histidine acid phosphatase [Muribaculaceae bacterium]|nr:histidine acid phosphatase [Muribaculaceae bacterium]